MPRRSRDLYVAASSKETNRIINDFLHSLIYRLEGDGVFQHYDERGVLLWVPCSGTAVKQDVAYFFLSFFLFGGDRVLVFLARTHVSRPTWRRARLCRGVCAGFLNVVSPVSLRLSVKFICRRATQLLRDQLQSWFLDFSDDTCPARLWSPSHAHKCASNTIQILFTLCDVTEGTDLVWFWRQEYGLVLLSM